MPGQMLIDLKGYEFSWCVLYFLLQYGKIWLKLLIYCPSDYMVKRKGIQDLINKIFGKGSIRFFLSMNIFHFQWEDSYILKLIWQIRLQDSCSCEKGLTNSTFQWGERSKVLIFEALLILDCHKSNWR